MATKLFLRDTTDNGIGSTYLDMLTAAGAGAQTCAVTTAGGSETQWTVTGGGMVRQWISGRAPAGGFTLTATDISIWAGESAVQANAGGRYRVFKRTAAGSESELGGGPFNDGVEFSKPGPAEMLWAGNVTDTAFAEDDRILLKLYITNVGTMGSGQTCTLTYNAADGATGDSFFNIAETVEFKAETPPAITGTATATFTHSQVGSAKVRFVATAAIALAVSMSVSGRQSFLGAASEAFGYSVEAVGQQKFGGTGSQSFGMSLAADGTVEAVTTTGTGALVYEFSGAGDGAQSFSGSGSLCFEILTAGSGNQLFSGVGALAFPISVSSTGELGAVGFSGIGSLVFSYSMAGNATTLSATSSVRPSALFNWSRKGERARLIPGRYWFESPDRRSRKVPYDTGGSTRR